MELSLPFISPFVADLKAQSSMLVSLMQMYGSKYRKVSRPSHVMSQIVIMM
jgi:hypothetical protein